MKVEVEFDLESGELNGEEVKNLLREALINYAHLRTPTEVYVCSRYVYMNEQERMAKADSVERQVGLAKALRNGIYDVRIRGG